MDNLPQLRDIHLPTEGVFVFPLAYGWWVILGICIACCLLIWLVVIIRKQSKKLYARYLLNKFAKENTLTSAVAMSEILRRICIKKYPEAVALSGQKWTDFLISKGKHKLSEQALLLLQTAPYRSKEETSFAPHDISDLRRFCHDWIGENL